MTSLEPGKEVKYRRSLVIRARLATPDDIPGSVYPRVKEINDFEYVG